MVELFHESDWKPVFKRAFSECIPLSSSLVSKREADLTRLAFPARPPRLLLLNPVCLIAAVYYAYIYVSFKSFFCSLHPFASD